MNEVEAQFETERELEARLKLKPGAMRRMRREARGPKWCRVGRLIRYRRGDVEAWLKANEGGK
ncbi:MAG: hypothetical protein A3F68_10670 [Acidobacteria bacterium RIFCSPLOWO2_12_FULL_54_10]|nr:MAG: hypothetical protein A3F68_10670 [Acidobacteria bacterium RIFCSPLOWO2_12_FULL_54_10]